MRWQNVFLFGCALVLMVFFNNCGQFRTLNDVNPSGNQVQQGSSSQDFSSPSPSPQSQLPSPMPTNPSPSPSNPTPTPSNPALTPTPIPSNGKIWLNEPAGFSLVGESGMNSLTGDGWVDVYNGYASSIVKDATAPVSPGNVMQQRFPAGLVGGNGGGGGNSWVFPSSFQSAKELYHGYWMKTDNSYENHPVMTKISWIHTTDTANQGCVGDNQFFLALIGKGPFQISANYQNSCIDNSAIGGGGFGTISIYPSAGSINPGQWALIEQYWKISSCNTCRDGIWKVWVNGTLAINVANMNTGRAGAYGVSHITVWGGTGSVKSRDSFLWFDHERVSTPR